jgi:glutaredoxin
MGHSFWHCWRRRRYPASLTNLRVVVYTRAGCCLCTDAWNFLQQAQQRHGFSLDSVDVDQAPPLAAQFGEQVPVVEVNGKVRFWGRINPVLVERLFRAEARRIANSE